MDTPAQDVLPIVPLETYAEWREEALRSLPSPDEWVDLVVGVKWAAELDRRGVDDSNLPKGLATSQSALAEVLLFLQQRTITQADVGPLLRLHAAIVDVAEGRASPLLTPASRKGGRPGKSIAHDILQAFAARAMSELMDAGDSKTEASERVAEALRNGRPDFHDLKASTVRKWRDRLLGGEGPGASRESVEEFSRALSPFLGATPRHRGEILLKILESRSATIG